MLNSLLEGPMRTLQSAGRTFSDAGKETQTPPSLHSPAPAAVALRMNEESLD